MSIFSTNIVTHLPSTTLGTLFKNPDKEDPNIYVLFCGHCCRTDAINATFLTYDNLTLNAKILNVNIWIDVAVAVLENPSQIDFNITTEFDPDPFFEQNEDVTFFSNYQINNSLARPIPSNVRDPNYKYPQNTNHFFYPESILLKEAQGVKGVSGSPVVDANNKVVGLASKIVGETGSGMNAANNLVATKMSMIYLYLFSENYGLLPAFYAAYQKNPSINTDFNLLVAFRNSFNIVICHTGFRYLSNRENIKNANLNLSKNILGSLLSFRMTGINKNTYQLVDYLQKNDPNIYNFRTLFDGTDLLNDFYKNKTSVLFRTLEYTDRGSEMKVIDFGIDSFAPYYINGDPSKPITVTYRLYEPSGEDGTNMIYGPLKTITVQPIIVDDSKPGKKRWSSQLPMEFTSTTSRANAIMQIDLFNQAVGGGSYRINYAAVTGQFTFTPLSSIIPVASQSSLNNSNSGLAILAQKASQILANQQHPLVNSLPIFTFNYYNLINSSNDPNGSISYSYYIQDCSYPQYNGQIITDYFVNGNYFNSSFQNQSGYVSPNPPNPYSGPNTPSLLQTLQQSEEGQAGITGPVKTFNFPGPLVNTGNIF